MAKAQLRSVLEEISTEVFSAKTLPLAQEVVKAHLGRHSINDSDKRAILQNVESCKNLLALQKYLCNSLLKFEGLSVNS